MMLAQADTGNWALAAFTIYIAVVLALAWLSNRLLQSKSFLSEYFLGSRGLGVWAFALTFAATSASGGSFVGFPSLVYTHGWAVGLWISSYMVVPLVSMGLLAKRINQIARRTGAITIPDVLRDRFASPGLGALATGLIVFFLSFNLVAQFKAGSGILQTLLADSPVFHATRDSFAAALQHVPYLRGAEPGYLMCLFTFAVVVVVYTTYGGFRAVVWTDVLQGFVMVFGVLLMLPLAIWLAGGMESATQKMADMTPPRRVELELTRATASVEPLVVPNNAWLVDGGSSDRRVFRTARRSVIAAGERTASWFDPQVKARSRRVPAIEITTPNQKAAVEPTPLAAPVRVRVLEEESPAAAARGAFVNLPGPHADRAEGFLPLGLAVSFFFMWTFSGAGQPSNMVRLMAFRSSTTLRRAIFTVAVYYSLIYFPLVVIFCCARVILPGWEAESDRIMPEMAKALTAAAGAPWLAGLLVAAPFAAVMSTMDSFLLMISSALVRDVYQRNFRPQASERTIKRLTYAVTVAIGAGAMLAAVNPPHYLQDLIIFTGSGLSTTFLAAVALALYWPRFNKYGAICSMLAGFFTNVGLYAAGYALYGSMTPLRMGDLHPFLLGCAASLIIGVAVALATRRPPERLVARFFYVEA